MNDPQEWKDLLERWKWLASHWQQLRYSAEEIIEHLKKENQQLKEKLARLQKE
jgi:hypothetical protein